MKQVSIIVAIAENNAIGNNNQLLWHIPDDLIRFKALTTNHDIIMGKKTFESLPIKPLPNRKNIVITDIPNEQISGCTMAYSIQDVLEKMNPEKENFIIGGGSIYSQFMPLANKLYITKVHHTFEADTFFPEIDSTAWTLQEESELFVCEKNLLKYSFLTFTKK